MRFLPPLVLHGAHRVGKEAVAQHIETFSQRLQSYPAWPELDELEQCPACLVPMTDRPVEHQDSATTGAK
jgi:glutathione-regulated potassium-efflux system ancillary protein KefF